MPPAKPETYNCNAASLQLACQRARPCAQVAKAKALDGCSRNPLAVMHSDSSHVHSSNPGQGPPGLGALRIPGADLSSKWHHDSPRHKSAASKSRTFMVKRLCGANSCLRQ